jgi:hypothetical protein
MRGRLPEMDSSSDPPTTNDGEARNFWISEESSDACEGDFVDKKSRKHSGGNHVAKLAVDGMCSYRLEN